MVSLACFLAVVRQTDRHQSGGNMKHTNIDETTLEKMKDLDELHYEITCKDDVAAILSQHKRQIELLMDMVGLLARAENHRIDRAKAKQK